MKHIMRKQDEGQRGLMSRVTLLAIIWNLSETNKCNYCNISLLPENNLRQHTMKGLKSPESRTWRHLAILCISFPQIRSKQGHHQAPSSSSTKIKIHLSLSLRLRLRLRCSSSKALSDGQSVTHRPTWIVVSLLNHI